MKKKLMITGFILITAWAIFLLLDYLSLIPHKTYTAEDFGYDTIQSVSDFNGNGIDDYTDFVKGARIDAENHPEYDSSYFEGGYPPDDKGVCTDVIWRAFKQAGYSLKDMVDQDIAENTALYPSVNGSPDPNIDFRRVSNLSVFFERYAVSLNTDPDAYSQWQPGDIVIYAQGHIALVSDKRNKDGMPYIIHNSGQPIREEDKLDCLEISGHFRFDASQIDDEFLIAFSEN